MKFMLMMSAPLQAGATELEVADWPAEAMEASVRHCDRVCEELAETGEYVTGGGLADPGRAKFVTARADGSPEVTDGPFAETKEFLLGYWIIDVESVERAYEIAARYSAVPGPDGAPANMPIEVREVMTASSAEA